ncbi:hypothetical protein JCM6882_007366 [Rhodosporidiobolus microsporus]
MAIRRPPTAYTLKPSDVADLQAAASNAAQTLSSTSAGASTATGGSAQPQQQGGRDELVDRERREREEREQRGGRGRVMGGQGA